MGCLPLPQLGLLPDSVLELEAPRHPLLHLSLHEVLCLAEAEGWKECLSLAPSPEGLNNPGWPRAQGRSWVLSPGPQHVWQLEPASECLLGPGPSLPLSLSPDCLSPACSQRHLQLQGAVQDLPRSPPTALCVWRPRL